MGEWEEKAWGRVKHLFTSPDVAISYLELVAGTRSSWHLHRERWNAFHVTSGSVLIEWRDGVADLAKLLNAGESMSIPVDVVHRFRVIESGRMVEIYWPVEGATVRVDDIERFDVGGIDTEHDQHRHEVGHG